MSEVDKRVVQLEFDNSKFEKNVKKSMTTLDKLKRAFNFDEVTNSIDHVGVKISALEIASARAISNITDKVMNLGINLVKSLSVDNISSGWAKFNEKTMSVATMASQTIKVAGKELEVYEEKMAAITEQLEKLNWFTDQTSYSFTDMVNNIGKFTAAGQDLDTSVEAMMGIANWAALSGQNAVTASRAMYQLAQAMSKGNVQLIDYKSIQNANMDTQEFRKTVLETAVGLGELTKQGETFITKTGKKFTQNSFTESLNSKWFTSDVLVKSLAKYSAAVEQLYKISTEKGLTAAQVIEQYGDQFDEFALKAFKAAQEARSLKDTINAIKDAVSTGWMTTSENIFGSYDESKVFWTELADALYEVFAEGGNFRNEILKVWGDLGGRANLFNHGDANQGAFWNIYDSIVAVIDLVKSSYEKFFPKSEFEDATEKVNDLASKLKSFTERLQSSTARIKDFFTENERLTNILDGVFSIMNFGVKIVYALRYAMDPIITTLVDLSDELLTFASEIGFSFTQTEEATNSLFTIARKINEVLTKAIELLNPRGILRSIISIIKSLAKGFKSLFKSFKDGFDSVSEGEGLKSFSELFLESLIIARDVMEKLVKFFSSSVMPTVGNGLRVFVTYLGKLIGYLSNAGRYVGELVSNIMLTSTTVNKAKESISGFASTVKEASSGAITKVTNGIRGMANAVNDYASASKKVEDTGGEGMVYMLTSMPLNSSGATKTAEETTEFVKYWKEFLEAIKPLLESTKQLAISILQLVISFTQILAKLLDAFRVFIDWLVNLNLAEKLQWVLDHFVLVASITSVVAIGISVAKTIRDFAWLFKLATVGIAPLIDTASDLMYAMSLKFKMDGIANIIKSFGLAFIEIAAAFVIFSSIDTKKLLSILPVILTFGAIIAGIYLLSNQSKSLANSIEVLGISGAKLKDSIKSVKGTLTSNDLLYLPAIIQSFSIALLEMAVAFAIFETVDTKGFINGTIVMGALLSAVVIMTGVSKKLGASSRQISKMYPSFLTLIGLVRLIDRIAKSLTLLSDASIDSNRLLSAASAISLVLGAVGGIALALNFLVKETKGFNATVKTVSIFVSSLVLLMSSVKMLAMLEPEKLDAAVDATQKLMISLAGVLVSIGIASKLMQGKIKPGSKLKAQFDTISGIIGGMIVFLVAAKVLDGISWQSLLSTTAAISSFVLAFGTAALIMSKMGSTFAQARNSVMQIGALATTLGVFIAGLYFLKDSNVKDLAGVAAVLTSFLMSFVGAILILANYRSDIRRVRASLLQMAVLTGTLQSFMVGLYFLKDVPIQSMLGAATAISIFMAALVGALSLLSLIKIDPPTVVAFASSMLLMSVSLIAFGEAFQVLNGVDFKSAMVGLISVAAGITILAIAAKVLQPVALSLLILSSSLLMIGASLLMVGLGMEAVGNSMQPFVESFRASLDGIIDIIQTIIVSIIEFVATLGDEIFAAIVTLGGAFFDSIVALAPKITEAVLALLHMVLTVLVETRYEIADAFAKLLTTSLQVVAEHVAEWGDLLITIILKILNVLLVRLPEMVTTLGNILEKLIVLTLDDLMGGRLLRLVNKFIDFLIAMMDQVGITFKTRSKEFTDSFMNLGFNIMEGIKIGLVEGLAVILEKIPGIGGKIADGFRKVFGIHSPSTVMAEMGHYLDEGLAKGVDDGIHSATNSMTDTMSQAISEVGKAISEGVDDDQLTITPVLDLTNVQDGTRSISDMMSSVSGSKLSLSGSIASSASREINRNAGTASNSQNGTITNNNNTDNYYSTFNITTDDPEEFARQTDAILQRNRMKANMAKGGV